MGSTDGFQIKNITIKVVFNYNPSSTFVFASIISLATPLNEALKLFIAIALYYMEKGMKIRATISPSEIHNTVGYLYQKFTTQ